MALLKESMTPFLTTEEVADLVYRLAKEIEIDYHGKEIVLICPLKGSFMFLTDLTKNISLKQTIDFVYLKSIRSGESVQIIKDIDTNITDKHVLIVEEIIDAGRTLTFLKERLETSRPASLRVVTLLDKPARREIALTADYIGLTIDDRYVVGYGMDSEEKGRNYKKIYSFKM